MTNRSADASIKGYCYQFDKTILEIVQGTGAETIVVEHIEDIDVSGPQGTEAIQCKYVPSKELTNSAVRPAIIPMLDHFRSRPAGSPAIKYRLYAHFAPSAAEEAFSLERLKELLAYREKGERIVYHEAHALSDELLSSFLSSFSYEPGPTFEDQHACLLQAIQRRFRCGAAEAEYLYYNNALRIVLDLCIRPEMSERTVTCSEFLARIGSIKVPLFSIWYIELRGRSAYRKIVRERIAFSQALIPPKRSVIFLEGSYLAGTQEKLSASSFVQNLIGDFYPVGKVNRHTVLLTFVINAPDEYLLELKRELIGLSIPFNDGYEHIEFSAELFDQTPIINLRPLGTRANDMVEKASYHLRIVSTRNWLAHAARLQYPHVALCFSDGSTNARDSHTAYFPHSGTLVMPIFADSLDEAAAVLRKGGR